MSKLAASAAKIGFRIEASALDPSTHTPPCTGGTGVGVTTTSTSTSSVWVTITVSLTVWTTGVG